MPVQKGLETYWMHHAPSMFQKLIDKECVHVFIHTEGLVNKFVSWHNTVNYFEFWFVNW